MSELVGLLGILLGLGILIDQGPGDVRGPTTLQ